MTAVLDDSPPAALRAAELDAGLARAVEVAARHADDVDRAARFPAEALEALRAQRLLSALVPEELGGQGLSLSRVARMVEQLGAACASTAMVFAMHQIQVACLARHATTDRLRGLLAELATDQLLLASATTEIGTGGDVGVSGCAVELEDGRFRLAKTAPVISYGEYADAILATARRSPEAPSSDQVLVVCRRADTVLHRIGEWDTLGFRGTCSPGFELSADGDAALVVDTPYADILAHTMLPVSHVLWAATWLGIASAAEQKARRFVQAAARSKPGTTPPGALRLAELAVSHQQLTALARNAAREFDESDPDSRAGARFGIDMNTLKVAASTLVVEVVSKALLVTGIAGYRAAGPYSLSRELRDAYGAAIMINNDRILAGNAQQLLVHRG